MVVTMPVMAMPMEATVEAVMASVPSVPAMATMAAMAAMATTSDRLSREGQRGCGQCQRRDTSRDDFLNSCHERLLVLCSAGSLCDGPTYGG